MKILNHPLLTLITLAAFIWLAYSSLQHADRSGEGHSKSDIAALNQIASEVTKPVILFKKEKSLTKAEQARIFASLFEEK